jgi:hypothetical protein
VSSDSIEISEIERIIEEEEELKKETSVKEISEKLEDLQADDTIPKSVELSKMTVTELKKMCQVHNISTTKTNPKGYKNKAELINHLASVVVA